MMSGLSSFDLTPLFSLMLMGLALALGPLAWVWVRKRREPAVHRLHLLTLVTLFLTFDLVLFGAFTRLSDSGLGCPDWPGCYGSATPVGAKVQIDAAQTALPSGPVTHPKAWIEMIHRYLATGVGVLILTLALATFAVRRATLSAQSLLGGQRVTRATERVAPLPLIWPVFTLLWVCLQGAFGALTVTMKLFPAIVTLHLLGGMVLLALLRAQSVFYARAFEKMQGYARPRMLGVGARRLLLAGFALLWVQIALGGWVSTNYAVLACTEFPGCQGALWPDMHFAEGFRLWRELGAGADGGNISFQALTAIHYVHRLGSYAVFAVLLVLSGVLFAKPEFRRDALWLGGFLVLQAASGLGTVLLGWPLLVALLHTGGAAALVLVLTGLVSASQVGVQPRSSASARLSAGTGQTQVPVEPQPEQKIDPTGLPS